MSSLPVPQHSPDAEHRFFIYDANNAEFYYFATAAERDQYSDVVVHHYLDDSWDETVEQVVAGEISHAVEQIDRQDRPDDSELDENGCDGAGTYWSPEWSHICNYALLPVVPVASGDAVQQLVAVRTLSAAVKLYKAVLSAHVDQFAAGTLDDAAYRVLREQWETALLQTTRGLSRDPVAPVEQVAA